MLTAEIRRCFTIQRTKPLFACNGPDRKRTFWNSRIASRAKSLQWGVNAQGLQLHRDGARSAPGRTRRTGLRAGLLLSHQPAASFKTCAEIRAPGVARDRGGLHRLRHLG